MVPIWWDLAHLMGSNRWPNNTVTLKWWRVKVFKAAETLWVTVTGGTDTMDSWLLTDMVYKVLVGSRQKIKLPYVFLSQFIIFLTLSWFQIREALPTGKTNSRNGSETPTKSHQSSRFPGFWHGMTSSNTNQLHKELLHNDTHKRLWKKVILATWFIVGYSEMQCSLILVTLKGAHSCKNEFVFLP